MHLPDVEGVGEQQVLRLGVAPRALSRRGEPGGADLHRIGAIGSLERRSGRPAPLLNVEVTGRANDSVVPDDRERDPPTDLVIGQRRLDVALRILDAVRNSGVDVLIPGL